MSTIKKNKSSKPSGLRQIKPYHASHMNSYDRMLFRSNINDNRLEYNQLEVLSHAPFFYKYLSLDVALKCIENSTLLFAEPSRWQDKYERRFYTADYSSQKVNVVLDTPILFATCMTTTRSNEASWTLYTYNKTGLGTYCVEFQINKHKFRQQLIEALENDDKVYEGVVMYCSPFMIDNIHKKSNPYYEKYVLRQKGIPYLTNYLNLLLMKRDAFKHENETRFFILKNNKIGTPKSQQIIIDEKVVYGESILLKIDWASIIEKVYINAEKDSYEYNLLSDALQKKLDEKFDGITDPVKLAEKEEIWSKKLKPEPYFIYGKGLEKPLVME